MSYQNKAEQSPSNGSSLYRALLTAAAAAGIAFGIGGSSAPAQTPNAPKQSYSPRAAYKPTLAYLVSQEELQDAPQAEPAPQEPPQEPKAEPKQEPKPQEPPRQEPYAKTPQELDLEHKAYAAYKAGRDAKPEDQLKHFVESYKLYEQAEAIAPPVTYADELNIVKGWVSTLYFKDDGARAEKLTPEQTKELDGYIANYGKEAPKPEPKPEPKQDPPKQEPKQDVPEPKPEPQPAPTQDKVPAEPKQGPYDSTLLSAKAGIGPEHRAGGAYLRLSGIEALADFERNKYETSNGDDLEREHIGLYAEADFEKMFGIPLRAHVTGERFEEILGSVSSDVQDDPLFNITTRTTSRTTTKRTYLDLGGELRLGDYGILAELFQNEEVIDVDVETLLNVINKLDPAGNYTDTIRNNQRFTNTTLGLQGGPQAYFLDDRIRAGLLLTYEDVDMPDLNRSVRRLRWHPHFSFISENKDWGFYAIGGESLLDDGGERLTEAEYGAVFGAKLTDRLAFAGRVASRERNRTRGMMTLLYCKDNDMLEYLLENERIKTHDELNLIKHLSPHLIDDYIRMRDDQILRWIADKEGFKIRLEGGAARVVRNGVEEVVPMYGGDLLTPVLWDAVTLGVGGYRYEGDESQTTGFRVHIFPKNKNWKLMLMGEQEETENLGVRDRRGLIVWDILSK